MEDYIDTVFGPQGLLARRFRGYAPRPGQIALARAVDAAIRDGVHLLAEAPTGTGKSVAYAVPASYHAAKHERRVVLVTSSINLQEQLVAKDLPMLAELLPWDFRFALLKGKRNYLCLSRLQEAEGQGEMLADASDMQMRGAILGWARTTQTGDVSELPFEPPARVWQRFSTSAEDCKGSDCRFYGECFAVKARAAADDAELIVSNYHMLSVHLQLREASGMDLVLPAFDVAVCDEGHKMADIAREFFGFRLTLGSIRWAGRLLGRVGRGALAERLEAEAGTFFEALAAYEHSAAYQRRLREPSPVPWTRLRQRLREAARNYQDALDGAPDADARADMKRAMARAWALALHIEEAMQLTDVGSVYFLEPLPRGGVALCSKAIDVSERLRESFFEPARSVIVTSATLTTGGRFDYARSELGVPAPRELVVESPFDFARQALLIVPEDMPEPTDPSFPKAVARALARIIELAGGRTLGLFTSYRNLEVAHARVAGCGYRVLRQGELPRTQLVEAFREDIRSVLLGTESFWAGVDVPGEALSCVVIDRLPFPSPDDPVLDALSERDPDWFRRVSLPRAIIAFKQGFGRLIRARTDRGVVVVLDERLVTKRYGRKFLRSLPPVLKSRRLEHVRDFLAEGRE